MRRSKKPWDLVVLGGGTAGIVAAKTAARMGASALLIEEDRTGGDCLWTGCVPSKALLSVAHRVAGVRRAPGVTAQIDVDFAAVMAHVKQAIATVEPTDSPESLRAVGAEVLRGRGTFVGPSTIEVNGEKIEFHRAVLATGSAPIELDFADAEPDTVLTSDTVWDLAELPSSLLVIGGGAIGVELGQAFARLGSRVTIAEAADRLLPAEEPEAARLVTAALQADGIDVRVGTQIDSVAGFDKVLVAVGRRPGTSDIGLDRAGVELTDRGMVVVNEQLRTTNAAIYAAGDLTGHPQFTHVAGVHGSTAGSNAVLGLTRKVDTDFIPRVAYTHPEVAAFGVPADAAGTTTEMFHHNHVDRAITDAETAGYTRLVLDAKGAIVGATIVGPRAGESLAEVVLAAKQGISTRDISSVIHAYPTYADGVWNAALARLQADLARPAVRFGMRTLVRINRWRA